MADIWGLPLNLYLGHYNCHLNPRPSAQEVDASQEVLTAIHKLLTASDITISTLEQVLQVVHYPTLLKHMTSPGLLPACMSLIRNYSRGREVRVISVLADSQR